MFTSVNMQHLAAYSCRLFTYIYDVLSLCECWSFSCRLCCSSKISILLYICSSALFLGIILTYLCHTPKSMLHLPLITYYHQAIFLYLFDNSFIFCFCIIIIPSLLHSTSSIQYCFIIISSLVFNLELKMPHHKSIVYKLHKLNLLYIKYKYIISKLFLLFCQFLSF